MVKPNEDEIELLFHTKIQSKDEVITYAKRIYKEKEIPYVVISLGGDGALLVCEKGIYQGKPPKIEIANTVGCGDSMVGAFAVALEKKMEPEAALKYAVSVASAANTVIVPIQCEFYALDGLTQLIYTIDLIQKSLNPRLKIEGVVFTMYDGRTNLSLQVVENVKSYLNQNIYKTIIPRNVRLAEAPSHGLPINVYAPRSSGAESYNLLAEEVIENGGKK